MWEEGATRDRGRGEVEKNLPTPDPSRIPRLALGTWFTLSEHPTRSLLSNALHSEGLGMRDGVGARRAVPPQQARTSALKGLSL